MLVIRWYMSSSDITSHYESTSTCLNRHCTRTRVGELFLKRFYIHKALYFSYSYAIDIFYYTVKSGSLTIAHPSVIMPMRHLCICCIYLVPGLTWEASSRNRVRSHVARNYNNYNTSSKPQLFKNFNVNGQPFLNGWDTM